MNRIIPILTAGIFACGCHSARGAKAPLSPEKLKKQSSHIVTGTVLEVSSTTRKSEVETGIGIHVDRIYTIRLKVKTLSKGTGIEADDEIEIVAWRPERRIPLQPGLQGHESIPKKGDSVTVYVKGKKGKAYEPILPNGIKIEKAKEKEKE